MGPKREPRAVAAVCGRTMTTQDTQRSRRSGLANPARGPVPAPRFLFSLGAAALLLGLMPGCIAVVAGAAGAGSAVAYTTGELDAELPAGLEKTRGATREAIHGLGFALVSERADSLSAVFICRTAVDKRVRIELERVGDGITKVEIRVGVFGDETVSLGTLEKIRGNLGL